MSAAWLTSHGNIAEKEGCVEVYRVQDYLKWRHEQPSMILHELSHAYHDMNKSELDAKIEKLYEKMVADGRYEKVAHIRNPTVHNTRHYALTTKFEYFAEGCEAYWGKNDFYPFTREELQTFDPELCDFLSKAWLKDQL